MTTEERKINVKSSECAIYAEDKHNGSALNNLVHSLSKLPEALTFYTDNQIEVLYVHNKPGKVPDFLNSSPVRSFFPQFRFEETETDLEIITERPAVFIGKKGVRAAWLSRMIGKKVRVSKVGEHD
jgi:ribosomal protein S3